MIFLCTAEPNSRPATYVDVNRAQRYGSNNRANEFSGGRGGLSLAGALTLLEATQVRALFRFVSILALDLAVDTNL